MARGSTDPATVEAEMNGADSPASSPPLSDKEWEAAAPNGDAEAFADAPPSDADDNEEAPDGKQKSMFADLEPPVTDDPLEFFAQLLKVQDTSGSQGDNIQAHFEAPWTEVLQVANRYKKALELRFGNVSVIGVSLKQQVTNTDADGNVRLKLTFTIPESQKQRASELFMLTGKGGPLVIEPSQLSLDALLTTRVEDDADDTPTDASEETS